MSLVCLDVLEQSRARVDTLIVVVPGLFVHALCCQFPQLLDGEAVEVVRLLALCFCRHAWMLLDRGGCRLPLAGREGGAEDSMTIVESGS